MKKNIFYISWNNSLAIEQYKNRQMENFREKYGKESVEQILLDDKENWKEVEGKLLWGSLLEEKRMFVFFGGESKKPRASKKSDKKTKWWFAEILEKISDQLSENDFLIFHSLGEWEENLKNWLSQNAKTVDYSLSFQVSDWKNLTKISEKILQKILQKYANAEKNREKWMENPMLGHAIFGSIKNLEILETSGAVINDEIIDYFCHEYDGQKIFDFIDAIMDKNYKKAIIMNKNFSETLHYSEVDTFFISLISLLKKNLYILSLKDAGLSQSQISSYLEGVHSFIIGKCLKSKITTAELRRIFKNLSNSVLAYRSWKWMKETILWRFLEIDTVLLSLKK